MSHRTKVRTHTAARLNGYSMRFVSELKSRGRIDDAGWGYCYLEDVQEYRRTHPRTSSYAKPQSQHQTA